MIQPIFPAARPVGGILRGFFINFPQSGDVPFLRGAEGLPCPQALPAEGEGVPNHLGAVAVFFIKAQKTRLLHDEDAVLLSPGPALLRRLGQEGRHAPRPPVLGQGGGGIDIMGGTGPAADLQFQGDHLQGCRDDLPFPLHQGISRAIRPPGEQPAPEILRVLRKTGAIEGDEGPLVPRLGKLWGHRASSSFRMAKISRLMSSGGRMTPFSAQGTRCQPSSSQMRRARR